MRNFKLTLEYDGTNYHGWQKQPGLLTIQGVLEDRVSRLAGEAVTIKGAGRTDAGVHALGQVANFTSVLSLSTEVIQRALNALLPDDIAVTKVEEVPLAFDAQRDAKARIYRYTFLIRPYPSPLARFQSLFIPYPLNIAAMTEAAGFLVGEHDFSSFRAAGGAETSPIRQVLEARFTQEGDLLHFLITADAFLKHMVRIIVGTLLEVGRGKLAPREFWRILEAKDRRRASRTISPHGLCLLEVTYEPSHGR